MAHLVDELFDLSRLQRGKVTLHLEPVELGSLVRHVSEDSREEFGKRGIELVVDAAETVVRGDASKLTQVLANLLHNAIKPTAAGGTVEVSVRDDGQAAVLTVSDTGAGIEPGSLATIFDPFKQGRDAEAGLGLGLYLVRMLCELHAGSVSVHSAGKGQGARFEVRLPVARRTAQQPPPPSTT
jgi:signal transduction histidine kinase